MKARFIGEDGSMGLKHGNVYEIVLYDIGGQPIVSWTYTKMSKFGMPLYYKKSCPYSDFKKLAENWETVEE